MPSTRKMLLESTDAVMTDVAKQMLERFDDAQKYQKVVQTRLQ